MPANPSAPFAFDKSGSVIVCADGAELLVYAGGDERPLWRKTAGAPLVAVGTAPGEVLSLDEAGRLERWEALRGAHLDGLEVGGRPHGLGVARDGTAVVALDGAVVVCERGRVVRRVALDGVACVAISDDGARLAAGTRGGGLHVFDARSGAEVGRAELGEPAAAVAWDVLGFFVVAAGERIFRVDADADGAAQLLRASGRRPEQLAVSADGGLLAWRSGRGEVDVAVLSSREVVGTVAYQRAVAGLAFGPDVWLGVGLDGGDGNKINLTTGVYHRTDAHPGRPAATWALALSIDKDKIRQSRSTANPSAGAVRAKIQEKAAQAQADARRGSAVTAALLVVIALVLLLAAGWLASR